MGADRCDEHEGEPKPCAGLTDLFFSDDPADQTVAKTICRKGCTHGVWCAEQALDALANGETGGVWAGMTLDELKEGLAHAHRNRARTAGHPSARPQPDADALSDVREGAGDACRDVRGVPPRQGSSSDA